MARAVGEQTVVITGASSGIGRETALEFGRRGATVVLAARNDEALREAAAAIERDGGRAHAVATDVADWPQVERLAREAVDRFGRLDTWVNAAGVAEYATVDDTTIDEFNRIIQVNLLGVIYGAKAALPHMRRQGEGTIINVGSVFSFAGIPLQAAYAAAKHGVRGFTDALRMELAHGRSGVAVTLVMPSSIDTPLYDHARSRIGVEPKPVPLVYEPRAVAETIVFAAEHPRREIVVGGAGKMLALMQRLSPGLVDWYWLQGGRGFRQQRTDRPDRGRDNLFAPLSEAGRSTGEFPGRGAGAVARYLERHPNRRRLLLWGGAAALLALLRAAGERRRTREEVRAEELWDERPAPEASRPPAT